MDFWTTHWLVLSAVALGSFASGYVLKTVMVCIANLQKISDTGEAPVAGARAVG